jgi:hypothetical protein
MHFIRKSVHRFEILAGRAGVENVRDGKWNIRRERVVCEEEKNRSSKQSNPRPA